MNGKRAKELRHVARGLSDTWRNYVATRQRDTRGRPVRPKVAENGCIVSLGVEIRNEEGTGMQLYRRMKRHYKRNKAYPHEHVRRFGRRGPLPNWLREGV